MNKKLFLSLVVLNVIGGIAAELYVPVLPDITKYFATTVQLTQYTIVAYLVGYALTGVLWGYASDFYGRMMVINLANIIGVVGTVGCIFASNIYILILARLLQGIGLGGVTVVGKAILRDMFRGKDLVRYSSYMGMLSALALDISPFVGSVLSSVFHTWRVVFIVIVVCNIIAYFSGRNLIENAVLRKPEHLGFMDMLKQLTIGLTNLDFIRFSFIAGISYSLFLIYIAVASYYLNFIYGFTPIEFGLFTIYFTLFFTLSSYINAKLSRTLSSYSLISFGCVILCLSGGLYIYDHFHRSMYVYIIATMFLYFGSGFMFSNSSAKAFSALDKSVGLLSSLYSAIQIIFAFLGIWVISFFSPTDTMVLGIMFLLAALTMFWLNSRQFKPQIIRVKKILLLQA